MIHIFVLISLVHMDTSFIAQFVLTNTFDFLGEKVKILIIEAKT